MSKITKYALSDLYDMSSGLSSKKEQAGHGAPFVSFGTVFNNHLSDYYYLFFCRLCLKLVLFFFVPRNLAK